MWETKIKKIPAALTAIIVVASITIFGNLDVGTVGSFIIEGGGTGLEGSLPTFQNQIFGLFSTLEGHWGLILSTAVILAAVGLIESLMTLNLIDEITETRGSGNRECVAQGGANILNGLFGGMGGCAMIGQSLINVDSGGRGRLSGIVAALALLAFVLFGAPLIPLTLNPTRKVTFVPEWVLTTVTNFVTMGIMAVSLVVGIGYCLWKYTKYFLV